MFIPKSMLKMFFLAEVRVDACKIASDYYDLSVVIAGMFRVVFK